MPSPRPLTHTLKTLLPAGLRSELRQWLNACNSLATAVGSQLFHRDRRQQDRCSLSKVNIGCGAMVQPGWINLDRSRRKGVIYCDVRNGLPFTSGSLERINAEHFLEHLSHTDAIPFLKECHRVLGPSGSIRLVVPDAEKYLRAYAKGDASFFDPLRHLGGASEPLSTNLLVINQMFRMGGDHLMAWDFETLAAALHQAGFISVMRSSHGAGTDNIDGMEWWRSHESLYVEACKAPVP